MIAAVVYAIVAIIGTSLPVQAILSALDALLARITCADALLRRLVRAFWPDPARSR